MVTLSEVMERLGYHSKTLNKATIIARYSQKLLNCVALARKQSCQGLGQFPPWKRCCLDSELHFQTGLSQSVKYLLEVQQLLFKRFTQNYDIININ